MSRRVFITGVAPICSLGRESSVFWENIINGRSCVSRIERLAGAPVPIGAEVGSLDGDALEPKERRFDRSAQLAILSARRAFEDGGLKDPRAPAVVPERIGVFLGTSRGAAELIESYHARFQDRGHQGIGPHASPHTTIGSLSGIVAQRLGLQGPNLTVSAACSSASQAIGWAFDAVRHDRADVMLAGGAEACLTPFCMTLLAAAGILSRRFEEPRKASRPFDAERDGIVVGEGAGIVVLESEESARARGARVLCELVGFGATCDAHSLTGIAENGAGLRRAVALALEDAGVAPGSISYVNAHGTATRLGDRAETAALKNALGARAGSVPVSSTKSMTGHLIGAAGGIEAIVCALAIQEGIVPPTINLDHPDPECDLDFVPLKARRMNVETAVSTSMGFGGNNACLVFRKTT
ncbi:MAG: beta-ketoacyl-[acyl-carrier-protein] synthase family protein [Vicinamibacteria bacterium]|nr:beta-ketoacyl-[acyl-carrier-protein] synthase family protein [Vicinamibacteria bacterium]